MLNEPFHEDPPVTSHNIEIRPVSGKAGRADFVDLGRAFAAREPHAVPQLRSEQLELIDPDRNPFFGHARVELLIAYRGGVPVGRISAHVDELALAMPADQGFGPGTGMFGYFDAEDEAVAHALLAAAVDPAPSARDALVSAEERAKFAERGGFFNQA